MIFCLSIAMKIIINLIFSRSLYLNCPLERFMFVARFFLSSFFAFVRRCHFIFGYEMKQNDGTTIEPTAR